METAPEVGQSAVQRRLRMRYPEGPPGRASDYVHHLPELAVQGGERTAVLYCRVSSRTQAWRQNLPSQIAWAKTELMAAGIDVIGIYDDVASGWWKDRGRLCAATEHARNAGALLVAVSTDRFIRSVWFGSKKQGALPTDREFQWLREATGGVQLATILHPDMSWREVRGMYSRIGQQNKGSKGGRPRKPLPGCKKAIREANLPKVRWMRRCGVTYIEIEKHIGVPSSTAQRWIAELTSKSRASHFCAKCPDTATKAPGNAVDLLPAVERKTVSMSPR